MRRMILGWNTDKYSIQLFIYLVAHSAAAEKANYKVNMRQREREKQNKQI
jgi:hypothetical protein